MIDYGYGVSLYSTIPYQAFDWRNDPLVYSTCRQYTLLSYEDHERWLESLAGNNSCKMFSIRFDGVPIGICGLTNINWQSRHAEISLYISPEYQGKKLSEKALKTLVRHAFEDFNLNKVWGEVFNNNLKSFRIFTKLGFVASPGHIQHYFRNGVYIDSTFVTLLAVDWFLNNKVLKSNDEEPNKEMTEGDDICQNKDQLNNSMT